MQKHFATNRVFTATMLALLLAGGCKQKDDSMADSAIDSGDAVGDAIPLDPAVTRELFLKWRSPRLGGSNPERLDNPVWAWLVRSRINAYQATQRFKGPSPM